MQVFMHFFARRIRNPRLLTAKAILSRKGTTLFWYRHKKNAPRLRCVGVESVYAVLPYFLTGSRIYFISTEDEDLAITDNLLTLQIICIYVLYPLWFTCGSK